MSLKSQIQSDINNIFLNTDEFAEDVTYVDSENESHTGKAIVNIQGDSDTEWAGGEVLTAEIIMDKTFGGSIKPHEKITDSENRIWTVTTIKDMDSAAITVSAHTDFKIRS
jgi:hypothetical protein